MTRVTVDLSADDYSLLEDMARRESKTKAELLRNGARLFDLVTSTLRDGGRLELTTRDGEMARVVLI